MIRQRSPSTGETLVARIWPAKDGIVQVALGYAHSTTTNDTSDTLGDKASSATHCGPCEKSTMM